LGNPWKFEVAAMLSQLGCVALDPDIIETVYAGGNLSPEDEAQYLNHPRVAEDLLKNIPRMEPIARMIAHQYEDFPPAGDSDMPETEDVRLGSRIIRAALTFDSLLRKGNSRVEAAHYLTKAFPRLDRKIIEAMMELNPDIGGEIARPRQITALTNDMTLDQDVRTDKGLLVAAKGQEVTPPLLLKLKSFLGKRAITDEVVVSQPKIPRQSFGS
jgi:hypothetical protein